MLQPFTRMSTLICAFPSRHATCYCTTTRRRHPACDLARKIGWVIGGRRGGAARVRCQTAPVARGGGSAEAALGLHASPCEGAAAVYDVLPWGERALAASRASAARKGTAVSAERRSTMRSRRGSRGWPPLPAVELVPPPAPLPRLLRLHQVSVAGAAAADPPCAAGGEGRARAPRRPKGKLSARPASGLECGKAQVGQGPVAGGAAPSRGGRWRWRAPRPRTPCRLLQPLLFGDTRRRE